MDTNEQLLEAFKDLCLKQRQSTQSTNELTEASRSLAIKLFFKGAELERSGDFGRAMEMYNRAYKLDPDVESHFDGQELNAHLAETLLKSEEDEFYNPFPSRPASTNQYFDVDLLADLKAEQTKPQQPEESKKSVLRITSKEQECVLDSLPDDILLRVLQSLAMQHLPSLEAGLARTCRRFYVACRQEALWTHLLEKKRIKTSSPNPRLSFINAPHFRTDGLYISKITYIRQGWEEGSANPPSFVVTYYRYLRFFAFPKRLVLALVSTEKPAAVIERMRSVPEQLPGLLRERFFSSTTAMTAKKKFPLRHHNSQDLSNFFIGTHWPDPSLANSDDDSVPDTGRYQRLLLFDCSAANPMRLQMNLRLGDRERGAAGRTARCFGYAGRVEYYTLATEREPGERVEFDVHNWGKFYFSRVKSYLT